MTTTNHTSSPAPSSTALERRLGPFDAAAIIVSNVIGGGILFTPPLIAANVPNPWLFLGIWVAGGCLAFAGAMAYAELAALRPRAGGEYVYLRDAYVRFAGFLTGWTSFVAGFAGSMAASAVVLVLYLDRFIPGVADPTPFFVIPLPFLPLTFSRRTIVAIVSVALLATPKLPPLTVTFAAPVPPVRGPVVPFATPWPPARMILPAACTAVSAGAYWIDPDTSMVMASFFGTAARIAWRGPPGN